jgi:beta-lactamase regulating signal transducer with metallopeptidase domain
MVAATIRATILVLIAGGVAALLRNRAAAVRHAVWTAAIAASLSLPLLSAMVPKVGIRNPFPARGPETSAAATKNPPAPRALIDVGEILGAIPAEPNTAPQMREVLLFLWLAGVILALLRILRSSVAVNRLHRSATTVTDTRIVVVWQQLKGRLPYRNVLLIESDSVTAPGTAGILRPAIVLPCGAAAWEVTRIRASLAHECAHISRRDCLTQLVGDLAVALYWFNPFIWYARRRMTTESERACDDEVIRDGVRPERYASVLVETVRASLLRRQVEPVGILSMARPSELETRLVSILDPRRSRGKMSSRIALTTACVATAAAVLISAPRVDAATIKTPSLRVSVADELKPTVAAPRTSVALPRTRVRVTAPGPTAQLQALTAPAGEPDRRRDSIAGPLSERLELSAEVITAAANTAALRGPDSALAHRLFAQLSRSATWEGDLVRDRSAWALSRQRNGFLVEPLIESLSDSDWRVRAYAAWALATSGAARAVPALVALLRDPNWRMRAMAAYGLEGIGDESAAPAMAAAAADEAWQVRLSAVQYIGRLHSAKYQSLLESALADRHIAVRQAASEAVGTVSNQ